MARVLEFRISGFPKSQPKWERPAHYFLAGSLVALIRRFLFGNFEVGNWGSLISTFLVTKSRLWIASISPDLRKNRRVWGIFTIRPKSNFTRAHFGSESIWAFRMPIPGAK